SASRPRRCRRSSSCSPRPRCPWRALGGLGIGLTLVRSLVELHGGTVQATSAGEGAGCVFEVELPLTVDPAPTVAVPESLPAARAERRRIVIVEDNVDAQQMLKCLLELWGHEVRAASDGEAGLRAIREERPDIALVDIGLPLLDGYEVARLLRDSPFRSGLLLVALTGYGSPEQRNRALEAGFDLHLVKPVDPQELSGLIAQCGVSGRRASASN
ncbi:MAG: hybrid sensor histidine kinase/response regulator, partial [Proteobacteria bacterium]